MRAIYESVACSGRWPASSGLVIRSSLCGHPGPFRTVSAPGRAGLAANQIGVSRRVFAYNIDGQVGHLANPVIEATEGEQEDEEGCLSIPGLWYPLKRAQYVRARGIDQLGQPAIVEGEDLLARCIQHEVDHLNGRLFCGPPIGECSEAGDARPGRRIR
jgi:Polypeptide deformylase